MTGRHAILENSIIVAAHPDDELLWFNSILKDVDQVVLVYEDYWPDPAIGAARREAVEAHPHPNLVSLKIPEAATYGCANWDAPQLSEYGIAFGAQERLRNAKQALKRMLGQSKAPRQGIRAHYEANFARIVKELRKRLKPDMNVFTHNPWGEYGHEDHIQVFRAVDKLRHEIGFKLWISNYCTERALRLAMSYFDDRDHDTVELPTDRAYAERVADVYRAAGCWTWADPWNWFRSEVFMEAPLRQVMPATQANLFPLNMFNIEPAALPIADPMAAAVEITRLQPA